MIGLIDAVDHYTSEKGAFSTFACAKIRSAILDAERIYDPRSHARTSVNEARRIEAKEAENAWKIRIQLSYQGDEFLETIEERNMVHTAIARLNDQEKQVIRCLYYQDLTMKQTAAVMGLDYTKVRRIHQFALWKLRVYMD